MIVGITGNIGAGKSSLSNFLKLKGFPVFDADEIGKSVLQSEARDEVVKLFGKEVLNDLGFVDTRKLGAIVFSDYSLLRALIEITHPFILNRLKKLKSEYSQSVVFVEAAVAVEYGWHKFFDCLVVVFAYKGQRMLRAAKKFGLKEVLRRDSFQIPYREKLKYADYLVCNVSTLLHLKEQSEFLAEEILKC